jgi:hypothetical protein
MKLWMQIVAIALVAGGRGHLPTAADDEISVPVPIPMAASKYSDAMESLFVPRMGMFRSHPGEDRCDAVDGPGILLLALMYLDGGELPESAFAF